MTELSFAERFRRGGWRGAIRAGRRQLASWIAPTEVATSASTPTLSAIEVSHGDALAWFNNRRSNYVALAECLRPHLPSDGVLLDVGANVGYFSKVVGDEIGFTGTAHLFEPIPHLADLCSLTLDGARFTSTVHPIGLSDEDATVDIYVADSGNLGWNTMVAERRTSGMAAVPIQVRRFDDLELDVVPDVVKIDVEGAEHRVLTGMSDSLQRWSPKPAILCEVGWGTGHPDWDAELAAFAMLEALGYTAYDLNGEPSDIQRLERTTDILFVPQTSIDTG